MKNSTEILAEIKKSFPRKFLSENQIFRNINRGACIFISTACGEPQYLVQALINFVESNPKAVVDSEVIHVWTLGLAPYTKVKFKHNFRHNSFFIANNTRGAVNEGLADYSPIFLSKIPALFQKGMVHVDVALIQTSLLMIMVL